VNLRTVTRGDAALAASALLLFISSFLTYYKANAGLCQASGASCSSNAWSVDLFPLLPAVFLLGIGGAALILLERLIPQAPPVLNIPLRSWGTVLTFASAWSALWALFGGPSGALFGVPTATSSPQIGAYLSLLFAALLVVFAVAGPIVPALAEPLLPTPAPPDPNAPHGYGEQHPHVGHLSGQPVQQAHPGQPFQGPGQQAQGGYGHPAPSPYGPPQPQAQTPAPQTAPPTAADHGAATPQTARLGAPAPQAKPAPEARDTPPPAADNATTRLAKPEPQAPREGGAEKPPAAAGDRAAPAFSPFWFAVPAARPLAPENDPTGPSVAELVPGTWYLAIAQHGDALLTVTQEGKRGLLADTSGIQRG
jgi:hypothetical protein